MEIRQQKRHKGLPKKDKPFSKELDSQVKKFYKDRKGKIYHFTPLEKLLASVGVDPDITDINSKKIPRVVGLTEIKKPTPAMQVLFTDKPGKSNK